MNVANVLSTGAPQAVNGKAATITGDSPKGFEALFAAVLSGDNAANASMQESSIESLNLEELIAKLAELLGGEENLLSIELSPDMLQEQSIQNLLSQLPDEMKSEIEALFTSNLNLGDLIQKANQENPEEIISLLIAFMQLNQHVFTQKDGNIANVSDAFNKLIQNVASDEDNSKRSMTAELINKIVQALGEKLAEKINEKMQNSPKEAENISKLISEFLKEAKDKTAKATEIELKSNQKQPANNLGFTAVGSKVYLKVVQSEGSSKSETVQTNQNTSTEGIKATGNAASEKAFIPEAPLSKTQQFIIHVAQGESKQSSQASFIEQFQNIMKNSKFSTLANGNSQLLIKLHPEHLGTLTVKLSQVNGEMMARIIASTTTAKEMLESNLNQLRGVFQAQNIQIDKLDVQQTQQQSSQYDFKEQQNNNQSNKQQHQNKKDDENSDENAFSNAFEEELLNLKV